jgi:hypothetical protein
MCGRLNKRLRKAQNNMAYDAQTVATLQGGGPSPLINVFDDPDNFVILSIFYFDNGAPQPAVPVVAPIGAGKFAGWTPPDSNAILLNKQIVISGELIPKVAAGNMVMTVSVDQGSQRVDNRKGKIITPIPNPAPAAFLVKTVGVTFV